MILIDDNSNVYEVNFGGVLGQGACRFEGFKRNPWGDLERVEIVIVGIAINGQLPLGIGCEVVKMQ